MEGVAHYHWNSLAGTRGGRCVRWRGGTRNAKANLNVDRSLGRPISTGVALTYHARVRRLLDFWGEEAVGWSGRLLQTHITLVTAH